jgi:hypothetical protein
MNVMVTPFHQDNFFALPRDARPPEARAKGETPKSSKELGINTTT